MGRFFAILAAGKGPEAVAILIETVKTSLWHVSGGRRTFVWAAALLVVLNACATSGPAPIRSAGTQSKVSQSSTLAGQPAPRTGGGIRVSVQKGDSVYALSQKYGATARAIIDTNSLRPPYILQPGQQLLIPNATLHVVKKGDTLYSISRKFRVDMASLAKVNGLRSPYQLSVNQLLKIPSSGFVTQTASVSGTTTTTSGSSPSNSSVGAQSPPKRQVALPKPAARSGKGFAWPVRGDVVMGFGPKSDGYHNDGINIAVPPGTEVHAAENGVVGYAGNELMGYGQLLLVRHDDGWITAYAHNSQLLVKRGDSVKRGQVVAKSGETGNVSRPQLHFEVRRGKTAINPMDHLVAAARAPDGRKLAALH